MVHSRRDHPDDFETELKFFAMRKAERKRQGAKNRWNKVFIDVELASPSTIDNDYDGWLDLFITSDEGTEDEDE
jgi:hypothetical protein